LNKDVARFRPKLWYQFASHPWRL